MFVYKICAHTLDDKTEYGIVLVSENAVQKSAPRLTENKDDMEALARMLNELEVEPCHFEDIIEDYLTDFSV